MSNRNTRYTAGQTGRRRPLSWWQTVHPGLRAAFITFWGIILVFGCSGVGLPRLLGGWGAIAFYGFQFLLYIGNGFLAGIQADDSRTAATRTTGYAGERAKNPRPIYTFNGLVAGVVLGIALVILQYVIIGIAVQDWAPVVHAFNGVASSIFIYLLIDLALATLGGLIGGFVYDKTH